MLKNFFDWSHQKRLLWFYWFLDVIKYPQGQILNFPLRVLRFILMPLNTLWWIYDKKYKIYDPWKDIYTIEGCQYTGYLFRSWSKSGMPIGQKYELVNRDEDGVITIKKIPN